MTTTIVSCYRRRLAAHLRNAADAIERGEDHYRVSTVSGRGSATDLVFEVDSAMNEDRHTHLVVRHVDDPRAGRPEHWQAGESLREWTR
jgi:hypothetical protein